jgi:hypothetical protein
MTTDEIILATALFEYVTFQPGSYDKRFARNMSGHASETPDDPITERQHVLLLQQCVRYRRQLPADIVRLAQRLQIEDAREREGLGVLKSSALKSEPQHSTVGNYISPLGLPG